MRLLITGLNGTLAPHLAAEAKAAPVAPTAPAEKRPSMGQIVSGSPRAADNFKNSLSKNTNSVKGL